MNTLCRECCDPWKEATKHGSAHDTLGSIVQVSEYDGDPELGEHYKEGDILICESNHPIKFCPWCGVII